jgi:hypothetical protein
LEQEHVSCLIRRTLRLESVFWLALALAVPSWALAAQSAHGAATQTRLGVETRDQGGRTQAALEVSVTGDDGRAAAGAVVIDDGGEQLAGGVLDAEGRAKLALDLAPGDHSLRAVYQGDSTHRSSASEAEAVHADAGPTPDFSISVAPASISLPLGQTGSVIASIKPVDNTALTAPMFVTLSCSGLPDQASCTFTPENIEILPTSCADPNAASCALRSTMVLETQLGSGRLERPRLGHGGNAVSWALVFPGALLLLGLARRRRNWLGKAAVLLLLGLVTTIGATACNARYDYYNHGPPPIPPTPAGTYTLTVTAQSNNGITATTHSTTMVLTVQ